MLINVKNMLLVASEIKKEVILSTYDDYMDQFMGIPIKIRLSSLS